MKKIIFMVFWMLAMTPGLNADQGSQANDQNFSQQLEQLRNPFEDGLPPPVVEAPKPVYVPPKPKPVLKPVQPKPVEVVIQVPNYQLQGVLVGEGMHEAIIDNNIVAVGGTIEGGRLIEVTKRGAVVQFKGKKVFLKVE